MQGPAGQYTLFSLNTLAGEDWEAFIDANARSPAIVAHVFNRKALEIAFGGDGAAAPRVSSRELAAMHCLGLGISRARAADTPEISEHTLRHYIESAGHKLGALNATHAVAQALSARLFIV